MNAAQIIAKAVEARNKVYAELPVEVQRIRKTTGSHGLVGPVVLYSESETRSLAADLFVLREVLKKHSEADLFTIRFVVADLLAYHANIYSRWYKMLETPQLFNEIAAALRDRNLEMTRDEIKSLLLECVYYTGRLNAWIDEKIPWSEICSLHDWVQACA